MAFFRLLLLRRLHPPAVQPLTTPLAERRWLSKHKGAHA